MKDNKKKSLQELREHDLFRRKQRDLEHAQQMAHIGNWELDLFSREMTCSREFYRIFGMSLETVLTEPLIREAIHPDDVGAFYAEVKAAKKGRRPFEFEGRIIRSDTDIRHVWVQGIWLLNESDECTHVFGVIQDITDRKKTERELLHTKTILQETLEHLDIVLWSHFHDTYESLVISESTEKVFGLSPKDVNNENDFLQIVHPDDLKLVADKGNSREPQMYEFRIIHKKTNEIRWIQSHARPERDQHGQVKVIRGISIDVTERKRVEEIMEAQNEVLRLLALGKPLPDILWKIAEQTNSKLPGRYCSIMLVDEERRVFSNGASPLFPESYIKAIENSPIDHPGMYASRAVLSKEALLIEDIVSDPLWEHSRFKETFEANGTKRCWFFPVLSPDHKVIATYSLFSKQAGRPKPYEFEMIKTFVHLTSLAIERKESEMKIHSLAFFDSLTGLYNRSQFAEQFHLSLRRADEDQQKLALLFVDLDQFKWVNDTLGHDAGDQLLIEVASRMRCCVGEEHCLARIGGDEFTILLRNVSSEEEAWNAARCVMNDFQEPVFLLGHEVRITASMGISIYPDHGDSVNELMKQADMSMYRAKAEGRNNVKMYSLSSDDKRYEKFVLKTQLHKALAGRQFVLHYQPRIELKTRKILSVEALIRWQRPDAGMIAPGIFIPLAEESGFIVPLGEWVMREACRQNKAWQDQGLPAVRMAVNVSAQQFQQESFIYRVKEILSETGMAPEWLEVEITESALMNHEKSTINKLQQLNQMGIHVSIDDFGTGYSSLNYLKSFEVSALKIDYSFIRDLLEDKKDEAITKMIITLAHNLELEVIGEGVESELQHDFLLQNGCEHAQGFLYSEPVSARVMELKLQSTSLRKGTECFG